MSSIKILKVKLKKKGENGLLVTIDDDGPCPGPSDKIGTNRCHDELVNAIQVLRSHLAYDVGFLSEKNCMNPDLLKNFQVTGYAINGVNDGKEDKRTIVVKGYKVNDAGKAIPFNTSAIRLKEPEEGERPAGAEGKKQIYPLITHLVKAVLKIEGEVIEYLVHGKKWQDPQQEFDMPQFAPNEVNPPADRVTRLHVAPPDGQVEETPVGEPGEPHEVPEAKTPPGGRRRRTAQTPDNPSGIVEK